MTAPTERTTSADSGYATCDGYRRATGAMSRAYRVGSDADELS